MVDEREVFADVHGHGKYPPFVEGQAPESDVEGHLLNGGLPLEKNRSGRFIETRDAPSEDEAVGHRGTPESIGEESTSDVDGHDLRGGAVGTDRSRVVGVDDVDGHILKGF